MDDLFKRANKYSTLEDDVRVATQQVLVTINPLETIQQEALSPRTNWGKLAKGETDNNNQA